MVKCTPKVTTMKCSELCYMDDFVFAVHLDSVEETG